MPQAPEATASEPVAALTDRYGGPGPQEVAARLKQPDMAEVKAVVSWRGVVVNGDVCLVDLALRVHQAHPRRILRPLRPLPHRRRHHARAVREARPAGKTGDEDARHGRPRSAAWPNPSKTPLGAASPTPSAIPSWRCWTWARSTSPPTPPAPPASPRPPTAGWRLPAAPPARRRWTAPRTSSRRWRSIRIWPPPSSSATTRCRPSSGAPARIPARPTAPWRPPASPSPSTTSSAGAPTGPKAWPTTSCASGCLADPTAGATPEAGRSRGRTPRSSRAARTRSAS